MKPICAERIVDHCARDRFGARPLQRQQAAIVGAHEVGFALRRRFDQRPVLVLTAGIDDDVEIARRAGLGRARDHQIVKHAALVVEQHGVADLARLQALDVGGNQALDQRGDLLVRGFAFKPVALRQREEARPHVRDIEQAGMRARPIVLGDQAFELQRHVVAGEIAELRRCARARARRAAVFSVIRLRSCVSQVRAAHAQSARRPRCPGA